MDKLRLQIRAMDEVTITARTLLVQFSNSKPLFHLLWLTFIFRNGIFGVIVGIKNKMFEGVIFSLSLCPILGTLTEGKQVAYIISVLFRNLWDACWRCNEPVEMQVCTVSVGLEKLKFHDLLSMLKSNNWFMDTMGPSRNSCTCLFEKLELHVALYNLVQLLRCS